MTRHERYHCIIERDLDGRVRAITVEAQDLEGTERATRLNGSRAAQVASAVHDILRAEGVTGRAWSSPRPIELSPVGGAQTELVLRAVKPLRRADRMDHVANGIAAMSREEASYWHAKTGHRTGLRALRVLLGGPN